MKRLVHLIGGVAIAIVVDYFAFDGYCYGVCSETVSQVYQVLSGLQQFKALL
jgi:hypothetical protein